MFARWRLGGRGTLREKWDFAWISYVTRVLGIRARECGPGANAVNGGFDEYELYDESMEAADEQIMLQAVHLPL